MTITTVTDQERGCGWRKPGGLYLMSGALSAPCGRLPLALTVCPCCGAGIKPARGWTWIQPGPLVADVPCGLAAAGKTDRCGSCPMMDPPERVGLLWIGEQHYPTPEHFRQEGVEQGISRRITAIPNDLEVGQTWVWCAHRKAVEGDCSECSGTGALVADGVTVGICDDCGGTGRAMTPGVFCAFRPERIEYVVKDDDEDEKLERLEARGVTLVKVQRAGELA